MKISPSIFKAYDVRGVYPREINKDVAFLIGEKLGERWQKGIIIIGHDVRMSSPLLAHALKEGILSVAPEIIINDVGLITTPMLTYLIHAKRADAGIMVTASHNPKNHNGFKIAEKKGSVWISGAEIGMMLSKSS